MPDDIALRNNPGLVALRRLSDANIASALSKDRLRLTATASGLQQAVLGSSSAFRRTRFFANRDCDTTALFQGARAADSPLHWYMDGMRQDLITGIGIASRATATAEQAQQAWARIRETTTPTDAEDFRNLVLLPAVAAAIDNMDSQTGAFAVDVANYRTVIGSALEDCADALLGAAPEASETICRTTTWQHLRDANVDLGEYQLLRTVVGATALGVVFSALHNPPDDDADYTNSLIVGISLVFAVTGYFRP